jgi:hypothetical protein
VALEVEEEEEASEWVEKVEDRREEGVEVREWEWWIGEVRVWLVEMGVWGSAGFAEGAEEVKGLGKIWTSREDDWKDAELRLRAERIGCCWVEEELERVDVVEVGLELLTAPTRKKDQVCQLSDRASQRDCFGGRHVRINSSMPLLRLSPYSPSRLAFDFLTLPLDDLLPAAKMPSGLFGTNPAPLKPLGPCGSWGRGMVGGGCGGGFVEGEGGRSEMAEGVKEGLRQRGGARVEGDWKGEARWVETVEERRLVPLSVGRGGRGIVGGWKGEKEEEEIGLERASLAELTDDTAGESARSGIREASVAEGLLRWDPVWAVGDWRGTKTAPIGLVGLAGPGTSLPRNVVPHPTPARPASSLSKDPPSIWSSEEDVTRRLKGICFLLNVCVFHVACGPSSPLPCSPSAPAETGDGLFWREGRETVEGEGGAVAGWR